MIARPPVELTEGRQGNYAGAVSRLAAFALDVGAAWGLYSLGVAAITFAIELATGRNVDIAHYQVPSLVLLVAWTYIYFTFQWGVGGKTIGMAVLGIQVVRRDGQPVGLRQSVLRTLTFPLSVAILGIGFLGIVVDRERRALHDRLAGTAVVYSWDARAARLRWLAVKDPISVHQAGQASSQQVNQQ
jgi:uncharacterized RDD family membrane protein YckC